MHKLTLTWLEAGQHQAFTWQHSPAHPSGLLRIGRDPSRCDLVLSDPTVSGLHVEIFWQPIANQFFLRNLRDRNPPVINGQLLLSGETALDSGSTIVLGEQLLTAQVTVQAIASMPSVVAATVLLTPEILSSQVALLSSPNSSYGLMCPKCHQVSAYERLSLGCLWCGTSLAAAASVLLSPSAPATSE